MARKIRKRESGEKNVVLPGEFQVLVATTNVEHYTYDGVDHGGERVAEEVRFFNVHPTLGSSIFILSYDSVAQSRHALR